MARPVIRTATNALWGRMLADDPAAEAIRDAARRCTCQLAFWLRDAGVSNTRDEVIWLDEVEPARHPHGWATVRPMDGSLGQGMAGVALALARAARVCDVPSFQRGADAALTAASALPLPEAGSVLDSIAGLRMAANQVTQNTRGEANSSGNRRWWRRPDMATTPDAEAFLAEMDGWSTAALGVPPADLSDRLPKWLTAWPSDTISEGRAGLLCVVPAHAAKGTVAEALLWFLDDLAREGPRGLSGYGPMRMRYVDGLAGLIAATAGLSRLGEVPTLGGAPWQFLR